MTRMWDVIRHPSEVFQITNSYTFNPKCVKMGELYGEYNQLTNEWKDGLASTIIRSAVADTTPARKWVVFDGPVDAIWIENMNTVSACQIPVPRATLACSLMVHYAVVPPVQSVACSIPLFGRTSALSPSAVAARCWMTIARSVCPMGSD